MQYIIRKVEEGSKQKTKKYFLLSSVLQTPNSNHIRDACSFKFFCQLKPSLSDEVQKNLEYSRACLTQERYSKSV